MCAVSLLYLLHHLNDKLFGMALDKSPSFPLVPIHPKHFITLFQGLWRGFGVDEERGTRSPGKHYFWLGGQQNWTNPRKQVKVQDHMKLVLVLNQSTAMKAHVTLHISSRSQYFVFVTFALYQVLNSKRIIILINKYIPCIHPVFSTVRIWDFQQGGSKST